MRNNPDIIRACCNRVSAAPVLMLTIAQGAQAAAEDAAVNTPDFSSSVIHSANSATDSISAGYMAQLVIGLMIVLFCIVALAWVAKRFNRLQSTPDGSLRVLGGMSMGARERIVLVQVGNRQLLLGVAPGRINTLHVLDEPLESFSDVRGQASSRGFAEKLSAALNPAQRSGK